MIEGNPESDVSLAVGTNLTSWFVPSTGQLLAIPQSLPIASTNFNYELGASGTESPETTFYVKITARGEETRRVKDSKRRYINQTQPSKRKRDRTVNITSVPLCLGVGQTLDSSAPTTDNSSIPGNDSGIGFSVVSLSENYPGGGQATNTFDAASRCLTSRMTIKGLRRMRSWYKGYLELFYEEDVVKNWTQTELKGPFKLTANDPFRKITAYTGAFGSGQPNVVSVDLANVTYSVEIVNATPPSSGSLIGASMIKGDLDFSGDLDNQELEMGSEVWAKSTYRTPWSANKLGNASFTFANVQLVDQFAQFRRGA